MAPSRPMDPTLQLLLPFLPLAMLTAAIVAFIRKLFLTSEGKPVIDGRAAVFSLALVVSGAVITWAQLRAGVPLTWTSFVIDLPVVFGLAVGGTAWLQRLRKDPFDVVDLPGELLVTDEADSALAAKIAEMQKVIDAMREPKVLNVDNEKSSGVTP